MATLRRERGWFMTYLLFAALFLTLQVLLLLSLSLWQGRSAAQAGAVLQVELQDKADPQTVQELLGGLRDQASAGQVEYVTREQAYEQARAGNPQFATLLEQRVAGNPFHDAVAVTLRSPSQYAALTAFLEQTQWRDTVDPASLATLASQERDARAMLGWMDAGMFLLAAFLSLAALVLVCGVPELTRRRAQARREELRTEHLLGAPRIMLTLPLTTEATMLLWLAALLAAILLGIAVWIGFAWFPDTTRQAQQFLRLDVFTAATLLLAALATEVLLVPLLSSLGARMGVSRYTLTRAPSVAL